MKHLHTRLPRHFALAMALGMLSSCAGTGALPVPEAPPDESAPSAADDLAAMDPRTPVPLQPMMAWHQKQNMQAHLVAIQRLTAGLAAEDWAEVAAASASIESSPQMQSQCEHSPGGRSAPSSGGPWWTVPTAATWSRCAAPDTPTNGPCRS